MSKAVEKIAEAIIDAIKMNYRRPRLWIGLLMLAVILMLLLPYIDSNFFYFSRMEKRINILQKVMALDQDVINNNPAYINEYQSILQEMEQQNERSINSVMNNMIYYINYYIISGAGSGNVIIKFVTGAIWCILITVCVPFMNTFKSKKDKILAFLIMGIVTVIVGGVCSVLPVIISPWVNYVGIPVLQVVVVIIAVPRGNQKKKAEK